MVERVQVESASVDKDFTALWASFGKGYDCRVGTAFDRVRGVGVRWPIMFHKLDLGGSGVDPSSAPVCVKDGSNDVLVLPLASPVTALPTEDGGNNSDAMSKDV